ncbi:DUF5667 domain-containing protein [Geodermatophilus sp. SYSU D01105]
MNAYDGPAPARPRRAAVRAQEDATLARLQALATALDDAPDPAFRAATRERLVAMAAVRTPEPAARWRLRRLLAVRADGAAGRPWRTRLTAGLAGAALTVSALGTLVALADDARPGDVLYGVKRGTEETQLVLAGDDRGLTLLQFAATRLEELEALSGTGATDVVVDVLDTMDAQTTEGAALLTTRAVAGPDTTAVDELAGWVARQSAGLSALQPGVPDGATTDLHESVDLLAAVGARAAGLRAALSCPGGPATDGTDPLGPVPVPCPAELPAPGPSAPAPSDGGPSEGGGSLPDPDGGQPAPGAPDGDAAPSATPAPPAREATTVTGSTPAPGRGGGQAPSTAPRPPDAGRPSDPGRPSQPGRPSLPVPLPPVGGAPEAPPASPSPPRPPLVDTPLPICIPPLIC